MNTENIIFSLIAYVVILIFLVYLMSKFYSLKNAKVKNALQYSLLFIIFSSLLNFIILSAFNLGTQNSIYISIASIVLHFFLASHLAKLIYKTNSKQSLKVSLTVIIIFLLLSSGFTVFVNNSLFLGTEISQTDDSMTPTLIPGEALNQKLFTQDISRGEIIQFLNQNQFEVARVVGLPNETITIANGNIYITNDANIEPTLLNEKYINSDFNMDDMTKVVKEDEYFIMNDNRSNLNDSRTLGNIKHHQIISTIHLEK